MDKQLFIGVDPGAKGAICVLSPLEGQAEFIDTTLNPKEILERISFFQSADGYILRAIMIEDVSSIQGASAKSNFSFGYNVGVVNTVALATGLMVDKVTAKKWQSEVGIKGKQWPKGTSASVKSKFIKEQTPAVCKRLYPDISIHGPKGGLQDGKADALLIAHHCYLKHKL